MNRLEKLPEEYRDNFTGPATSWNGSPAVVCQDPYGPDHRNHH